MTQVNKTNLTAIYVMLLGLLQTLWKLEMGDRDNNGITSQMKAGRKRSSCPWWEQNGLSDGQTAALQTLTELFHLPNAHTPVTHTHIYMQEATLWPRISQCAVIQLDTLACCLNTSQTHAVPRKTICRVTRMLVMLFHWWKDCFNGGNCLFRQLLVHTLSFASLTSIYSLFPGH